MRKLLTPISVVGIGLLAAMPFRKQPDAGNTALVAPKDAAFALQGPSAVPNSEFALQNQNRLEGPRSVVPLREEPVRERPRWMIALDQQTESSEPVPAAENPYELVIRELPSSYEDIAIPLSSGTHSGNLLATEQQATLIPDRFGIPREVSTVPESTVPVSTVPVLTPFVDSRSDQPTNVDHGIAAQSAKFQTVKMQELSSELPLSAGNTNSTVASETANQQAATSSDPQEPQPKTTRQRHFIRVPRP